jgi:fatty acid desaturase
MITKIHNKYYDLSKFKHPGGIIPLQLADNRDATELFESHHLFSDRSKLLQILAKCEIQHCDIVINNNDAYDWELTLKSDFTREFKQILKESLEYKDMKATWYTCFKIAILGLLFIGNIYYYYQGSYVALLFYPATLWVFTVNIYHDASHFALSHKPFLNILGTYCGITLSTNYCWYHQHIIGHHCFVNILGKDPDLYHSTVTVRHTYDVPKNILHAYQYMTAWLMSLFAIPIGLQYIGFMQVILNIPYKGVVKLSTALDRNSIIFEFAFVITYMIILPYTYIQNVLFIIYPIFAYSLLFMICTQVNHLTLDTFCESKNFYIHQIVNSHNISPQSFWIGLITGGLNLQIEHHLVPSVNHDHLRKIQPKIKALCKKYNIPYNCSDSMCEALYKHILHLYKFSL